jgi:hypothetical protein
VRFTCATSVSFETEAEQVRGVGEWLIFPRREHARQGLIDSLYRPNATVSCSIFRSVKAFYPIFFSVHLLLALAPVVLLPPALVPAVVVVAVPEYVLVATPEVALGRPIVAVGPVVGHGHRNVLSPRVLPVDLLASVATPPPVLVAAVSILDFALGFMVGN